MMMQTFYKIIFFKVVAGLVLGVFLLGNVAQAQVLFTMESAPETFFFPAEENIYLDNEEQRSESFESLETFIEPSATEEYRLEAEIIEPDLSIDGNYLQEETFPLNSLSPTEGDPFDFKTYQNNGAGKGKTSAVNANVDEFSGAAALGYGFDLPPGRNGIQPQLSISYHSQNQDHENLAGFGWSLNIPEISRSMRLGSDRMYSVNEYNLKLEGKAVTLLPISLSDGVHGLFGAEVEDNFWQANFELNGSWRIRTKSGLSYNFGSSTTSRQEDAVKVYKWLLENIEDQHGNTVEYEYYKDSGQIYPSRIIYTNNKGNKDGQNEVRFQPFYQGPAAANIRPDKIFSYQPGFYSETKYRLEKIEVVVKGENGGQPVKSWNLAYSQENPLTQRSLLSSITENGVFQLPVTGNYQNISRPATTFTYQSGGKGWGVLTGGLPVDFNLSGTQYADLNGDGLIDGIRRGYLGTADAIFINRGNNRWQQESGWQMPPDFFSNSSRVNFFGEINGDGLPDIFIQPNIWNKKDGIFLNDGNKAFPNSTDWKIPASITSGSHIHFADMNGDGLSDIVSESGEIFFNDGISTWVKRGALGSTLPQGSPIQHFYISDLNGDGLNDIITGSAIRPSQFYLNTGNGWQQTSISYPSEFSGNIFLRFLDVNNDGLTDYGVSTPPGSTYAYVNEAYINTGKGFVKDGNISFPDSFGRTNPFEISGNLSDDIGNSSNIWENRAAPSGLLSEVKLPSGGKIGFEYAYSALPVNNTSLNPRTANRRVVSKVSRDNGLGQKFSTGYEYRDGAISTQSPQHKTFGGFHEVIKTEPDGQVTKTFYYQGGGVDAYYKGEFRDHFSKIGKPYRVEVWGNHDDYPDLRLFQKTVYHYDHTDLGNGRFFIYLARLVNSDFEGKTQGRHRAFTYEYDSYGNVRQEVDLGEVDTDDAGNFMDIYNDRVSTITAYAQPTAGNYLYNLPVHAEIYDGNNTRLREKKYFYDNLSYGSASRGLLSSEQAYWDQNGSYITGSFSYDRYGNAISQKNPRGYESKISYDAAGYFPTAITNAKNQVLNLTFNPVLGQVKKVTGLNGEIKESHFDSFGRVRRVRSSGVTGSKTLLLETMLVDYNEGIFPNSIITTTPTLLYSPALKESFSYLDGFGNEIQTRVVNKNGQFSVGNSRYNSVFQVDKTLFPYFESGAAYLAPNWNLNGAASAYDALRRLKTLTTPLGSTKHFYASGKETVIDAENHNKEFSFDIFGRLTGVIEKNAGDSYETTYKYSALGELLQTRNIYWDLRDFSYDSLGNPVRQSLLYPTGGQPVYYGYSYDANGNLLSSIDPKGQRVNYQYDELDRIKSEDYTGQSGTEVIFSYDLAGVNNGMGRLGKVMQLSGNAQNFHYDNLGNISQENWLIKGINYDSYFTYDDLGRLSKIMFPSGEFAKYEYAGDLSLNRLTFTQGSATANIIVSTDYEAGGQLKNLSLGNGANTGYVYEPQWNNLLKGLMTTGGGKVLQNINYTYDKLGNVKSLVESGANATARSLNFTYDDLSRLKKAEGRSSGGSLLYSRDYEYDPAGNIQRKNGAQYYYDRVRNALPTGMTEIVDDQGRQLFFSYDPNGNIVKEGQKDYKYDYRNRLVKVEESGGGVKKTLADFDYDRNGGRIIKSNAAGEDTVYVKDFFETGPEGTFIHLSAFDRRIARVLIPQTGNPELNFIHGDHLGSTSLMTDISGNLVEEADYFPYGETRTEKVSGGTVAAKYKFTGKEEDKETGLYYYGARYYSPVLGRFLTVDPLQLRLHATPSLLTDPQSLNEYAYARNNPLKYVDPTGEFITSFFFKLGGGNFSASVQTVGHDSLKDISSTQREIGSFFQNVSSQSYQDAVNGSAFDKAMLYPGGFLTQTAGDLANYSADIYDPDTSPAAKGFAVAGMALEVGSGGKGRVVKGAANEGITVLGKFPGYLEVAKNLKAKSFNIPEKVWGNMSKSEQWAANRTFLDRTISRGDRIILSETVKNVGKISGQLKKELNYLINKGYKINKSGKEMVK